MRFSTSFGIKGFVAVCLLSFSCSSFGVSLNQLRNTPDLTPARFAAYFRGFEFKFRKEVQSPEVFLASRSGDCDDFSTLAATILREKGYTPRLITVRMPGVVHVVCYIEETQSYLDYNHRGSGEGLVRSKPQIEAVAASVAKSYGLTWSSATEFTYDGGLKRLVRTVSPRGGQAILATVFK